MPAHPALPKPRRLIEDKDVKCPAASQCGGVGVHCGVEGHFLDAHLEPTSIGRYCLGDFTQCPTWRAEKERIWARDGELVG